MLARRRPLGGAVAVLLSLSALLSPTPDSAEAQSRPPLYVMADSVMLGADGALRQAFPGHQVNMAGFPAIFTRVAADVIRQEAWRVGDVAVVAVGHNYPFWDPDRFDRAIDAVVENLVSAGAEQVIWVTLRHATHANSPPSSWWQVDRYAWYFPTVNAHLRRALDRHPELSLADWAAVSGGLGLTYDSIHLNSAGQAAMAGLVRRSVDDARNRAPRGSVLRMTPADKPSVPADARGVIVQAEFWNPRRTTHADVYACGRSPATGHRVTVPAGGHVHHQVFVRLTSSGQVCTRLGDAMQASTQVLSYAPRGSPTGNPPRRLATEVALTPGQVLTLDLPSSGRDRRGAALVEIDATARATYTAYPCDQRPLWGTPLRSAGAGRVSHAVVRPSVSHQICVQTRHPAVFTVNLLGSVANQAQLRATRPIRLAKVAPANPLAARSRLAIETATRAALPRRPESLAIYVRVTAAFVPGELEIGTCGRPAATLRGWRYAGVGATTVAHIKPGKHGKICVRSSQPVSFDAFAVGWSTNKPILVDAGGRPAATAP